MPKPTTIAEQTVPRRRRADAERNVVAILAGAREEEAGMISGLNSTGHEIGGTLGIAIFSTIAAGGGALAGPHAASGIAHAFAAGALLATVASLVSLAVLPRARHFVPRLRLSPSTMPTH